MKVKECMTTEVITVKRSTSLSELIEMFRAHNFHTLPVIEDNKELVGIVTFEDIMTVFQPYNRDLSNMLKAIPFVDRDEEDDMLLTDISSEMGILVIVDDFMNTQTVSVESNATIKQARALMKMHGTDTLAVVEQGKLAGIVTLFDIIISVFKEKGIIK